MRRTKNVVIQDLATRLRNPVEPRPLLLLGSGCSVSAGLPDLPGLLESFDVKSVVDLCDRFQDENTLRAAISDRLGSRADTSAYDLLALLVAKGFFDTILSTNWDFLLEKSLSRFLSPEEYRVFVRPLIPDPPLVQALQKEVARVKVVKLHGDVHHQLILDPKEFMKFDDRLTTELRDLTDRHGLVVIGYGLKELRFFRVLGNVKPIVVDPADLDPDKLRQCGLGAQHVGGEEGDFGTFMQCLCSELLPVDYRDLIPLPPSETGAFHPVTPPPGRRQKVRDICEPVGDWIEEHNVGEERVRHLTHGLLTEIRRRFHDELHQGGNGVCLVFVMDSMAPGGTEIHHLTKVHENLGSLTVGMKVQSVEIAVRYGAERHVVNWTRREEDSDLSRFGAVVLIDSVSFSGNTLEVARDYLSTKGNRARELFTAALLLLPNEAERRLRSGAWAAEVSEAQRSWKDVISPAPNYSGFEVTFPWGWTTATLPLEGRRFTEADTFIPSREFSFIPKPWGEQLVFCKDERVTVSLLVLSRGQRTSTHYHLLRTETFVILEGRMRLCLWDQYFELRRNESIRIPPGVPHALIALDQACRVLEIASGPYDLARDIVRLSDNYARQKNPDESDNGLI